MTAHPERRDQRVVALPPPTLDVSVVVVSYNTRELTVGCLRSVLAETRSLEIEIIVIDNDSEDGTVQAIRQEFPDVRVIANRVNVGFAGANNQGFALARGRYVLVLNPDTEVQDDAIGRCVRFAAENPDAGVIGCRSFEPDGTQQPTMFRYLRLGDVLVNCFLPYKLTLSSRLFGRSRYVGLSRDEPQDVEVVTGCFMLVRREVLEQVGVMDDAFFMFGEEAEWCYRIRKAGWKVVYYPEARILHHSGASAAQKPAQMRVALARGQILLLRKTQGAAVAYLANVLMLLRDLPRVLVWALLSVAPGSRLRAAMQPAVTRLPFHLRSLFLGTGKDAHAR